MTLELEFRNKVARVVSMALEDESFSDFLERFDMTPEETFLVLYEEGHIDPDTFEEFLLND